MKVFTYTNKLQYQSRFIYAFYVDDFQNSFWSKQSLPNFIKELTLYKSIPFELYI